MKRLKGLGARRSSFEIPKRTDDVQTPEVKRSSRIGSAPGLSSPRDFATGVGDRRRSGVDEHRGSGAMGEERREREEKLLVEYQQVLSVPGDLKSSVRGMVSRRSSFSSCSDFQSSSSSRPSDASSMHSLAISSSEVIFRQGRSVEQRRAVLVAFDVNARGALVGAVTWTFRSVLRNGDELVLIGVMDFIRGPLGYKCQVNDQTWLGANQKQLRDEIALKKLAWSSTPGLKALCEERGVKLVVDVKPAQRPEVAVVQEAAAVSAVHVVLDKSLNINNRRRKYILERLNCDVTRVRRSGGVEVLRSTTAKEAPASPTSVIPPSEFRNRAPSDAAPALLPSASLRRDDEEELFTIDHWRHGARMFVDEGYESDDLFSLCGDGGWRTSSFAAVLDQRPGAETQSARNSMAAAHDYDPARPSVDSGSRLDKQLLSLTRLQLED